MSVKAWTCARCSVEATYASAADAPAQPHGWAKGDDGWHCLGCRRETAMDRAGDAKDPDGRAQRRRALMEFELLRDPEASDVVIAKRARCSTARVRPVRADLHREGRLPATEGL